MLKGRHAKRSTQPHRTRLIVAIGLGLVIGLTGLLLGGSGRASVAWAIAIGAIAAAADPRVFLWAGVVCLVATPMAAAMTSGGRAEDLARAAFYFLAVGVALEFRSDISTAMTRAKTQETPTDRG